MARGIHKYCFFVNGKAFYKGQTDLETDRCKLTPCFLNRKGNSLQWKKNEWMHCGTLYHYKIGMKRPEGINNDIWFHHGQLTRSSGGATWGNFLICGQGCPLPELVTESVQKMFHLHQMPTLKVSEAYKHCFPLWKTVWFWWLFFHLPTLEAQTPSQLLHFLQGHHTKLSSGRPRLVISSPLDLSCQFLYISLFFWKQRVLWQPCTTTFKCGLCKRSRTSNTMVCCFVPAVRTKACTKEAFDIW